MTREEHDAEIARLHAEADRIRLCAADYIRLETEQIQLDYESCSRGLEYEEYACWWVHANGIKWAEYFGHHD